MFIASCPLRISLFGGSTDNPYFIEKYGHGSVISFSSNLSTYVTLTQDARFGYNQHGHKYILNYSKREEVESISEVQNELIRSVLEEFELPPISISLTSDVYSHGSGLASSSSYIISLIKAISLFKKLSLTDNEICELAYNIELKTNPYCGYQDPYGCGIAGFKRMDFTSHSIKYEFFSNDLFKEYDAHLIYTGITRNSTDILRSVSGNIDKAYPLLKIVDEAHEALIVGKYDYFINLINESWECKKNTSDAIIGNDIIRDMDYEFAANKSVLAHKLCGAGSGGFFLVFSKVNTLDIPYSSIRINVSQSGVKGEKYGVL